MANRKSKHVRRVNRAKQVGAASRFPKTHATTPSRREQVFKRDARLCRYCGARATTIDHVVPRCRGGTNALSNLRACCVRCNNLKADMPLQKFLPILQKVLAKALRRIECATKAHSACQ